jgi:hypothetical protein
MYLEDVATKIKTLAEKSAKKTQYGRWLNMEVGFSVYNTARHNCKAKPLHTCKSQVTVIENAMVTRKGLLLFIQ